MYSHDSLPLNMSLVSRYRYLWSILFIFLFTTLSAVLQAEEKDTTAALSTKLEQIEKTIPRKKTDIKILTDLAEDVTDIKGKAKSCVTELEPQKEKTELILTNLGEPGKKDPKEVRQKRNEVKNNLAKLNQELASCHVLIIKSDELLKSINDKTKKLLATQLLAKGPDIVSLLKENWDKPMLWITASKTFIKKNSGLDLLTTHNWITLVIALALMIGIGMLLRRYLCNLIQGKKWSDDYASRFIRAIVTTLAYYAPFLLGSTASAIIFFEVTKSQMPIPFISVIAIGLPFYFLFIAVVRLLLNPPKPAPLFLDLSEKYAPALAKRLEVLALLTFLGYLLFSTLLAQSLPEPTLLIARAVFATFLIINLIWAISIIMRLPRLARMHGLKILVYSSLIVALVIEWMGYRNLSFALAKDILGSLLAFGLFLLSVRLFRELYDSLSHGSAGWSRSLRKTLGIKESNNFPGLTWLRLITTVTLLGSLAFVLLLVWDVSETIILDIQTYLTQGFSIGSLLIIPEKIAGAVLTIAIIIVLGGWFRNRMETSWLTKAYMSRGAKEALVTITGYIVIGIAFIVGLGVAGFDFGSLAIIAGALSVGIGFGLQNVVNNFLSGLILLFERPIKTGDWIVVGGTEGHVKRIRIRSTQIQTFDRADVIVPNSELISSQVTNWMLNDARGRARIAVGVAYGTNTQKVKTILEEIAAAHPKIITNGSSPKPKVLFRGFGDSSLDFELRCYIENIDERIEVISDINFSIDAAFRENNIEIPFPQRDIHIRSNISTTDRDLDDGM